MIAGFILGMLASFPVLGVCILALWATTAGVGTVEMIRDWRRYRRPRLP